MEDNNQIDFIEEMTEETLQKVLNLTHKLTGITMNNSKKMLLQGRIRPRLKALNLKNFEQYVDYLIKNNTETQNFINIVTTNETSFFRTPRIWEYFNKIFLPTWFKNSVQNEVLKIWSGAASSGEEIYSILMCCEEFKLLNPTFNYQIVATDISTHVLSVAKEGVYQGRSIENFKDQKVDLFKKYFIEDQSSYKFNHPMAQSKISFSQHNLLNPLASYTNYFDIIFLRNVLIYFESIEIENILKNISLSAKGKGILIIGESESLSRINSDFKFIEPQVYEK